MTEFIAGIDEAGTGCFAGPFTVCALIATQDWSLPEVKDSKAFTGATRDKAHESRSGVYDLILGQVPFIQYFTEWVFPEDLDRLGLGKSHYKAVATLIERIRRVQPDCEIIVDGSKSYSKFPNVRSVPKADALFPVVSAASILAKVERDRYMMTEADSEYPQYGFINHVGYGTNEHKEALAAHGPCPIHRFSFAPIAKLGKREEITERTPMSVRPDLSPDEVIF